MLSLGHDLHLAVVIYGRIPLICVVVNNVFHMSVSSS